MESNQQNIIELCQYLLYQSNVIQKSLLSVEKKHEKLSNELNVVSTQFESFYESLSEENKKMFNLEEDQEPIPIDADTQTESLCELSGKLEVIPEKKVKKSKAVKIV